LRQTGCSSASQAAPGTTRCCCGQLGLAVGGGAEIELIRSFALRLEALHYIFPEDGAPLSGLLDSENQHTTVRAGVIFKLN
jgi:hypothetical protein